MADWFFDSPMVHRDNVEIELVTPMAGAFSKANRFQYSG